MKRKIKPEVETSRRQLLKAAALTGGGIILSVSTVAGQASAQSTLQALFTESASPFEGEVLTNLTLVQEDVITCQEDTTGSTVDIYEADILDPDGNVVGSVTFGILSGSVDPSARYEIGAYSSYPNCPEIQQATLTEVTEDPEEPPEDRPGGGPPEEPPRGPPTDSPGRGRRPQR